MLLRVPMLLDAIPCYRGAAYYRVRSRIPQMSSGTLLRAAAIVGLAGLALALYAPSLVAGAIPLLLVAACPVSMLVMMRSMSGHAPGRGSSATPPSASDLRHELADLAERQRRLEAQLAFDEPSTSLAVSAPRSAAVRDG